MQTIDCNSACIELVGAVIHQTIVDYFSSDSCYHDDARDFLFSTRIHCFVQRFHLDGHININFLRKQILAGRKACELRKIDDEIINSETINKKGEYHGEGKAYGC